MNTKDHSPLKLRMHFQVILPIFLVVLLMVFCQIMSYPLIIPVLILFVGLHLFFLKKIPLRHFLHLGLLLALLIFTVHIISRYTLYSPYYIPVAGMVMLTMLLFNETQVSFQMAFLSSTIVTLILGSGLDTFLTFFLGSLMGIYAVREARTRGQLMKTAVFVALIHMVSLFLFHPHPGTWWRGPFFREMLYPLLLNGLLSTILVVVTLKIFEYLFGVITNFSLLELSDFNQPLLKRLILEAPGTYHHSLVVSNLAETAADSIGANALLTRVGAYYHDIGKVIKPEYFTENQLVGGNKHDYIEPSMSRLIILNHVKEGIELGRKYRLNPLIIEFIPQHHGTSLMHYFYQKALEETKEGEPVSDLNFRYPGPKPQTKETAITLLADSVEGATRSLKDFSSTKIAETVRKVINNRFIDGQLDECNLTLKEINQISETFIRILTAMYHGRIKYPDKKDGNSNRKFSKESTPNPQAPD